MAFLSPFESIQLNGLVKSPTFSVFLAGQEEEVVKYEKTTITFGPWAALFLLSPLLYYMVIVTSDNLRTHFRISTTDSPFKYLLYLVDSHHHQQQHQRLEWGSLLVSQCRNQGWIQRNGKESGTTHRQCCCWWCDWPQTRCRCHAQGRPDYIYFSVSILVLNCPNGERINMSNL